jgi:hypothetical protein
VVAGWIAETQAERPPAEQRDTSKDHRDGGSPERDEIIAIVEELGDMVTACARRNRNTSSTSTATSAGG